MNWQEIIDNSELVYASVSDDNGFRTWSLKETTCNVSFYEEFPIEDIDKIVCNILYSNNNTLDEERFATILGFNVIDNFETNPKRYADNAEFEVFKVIIQTVIDWGLIAVESKNYLLTELGKRALLKEKKYKFYKGQKKLLENPNIKPVDAQDNLFFHFYNALGVFSEITNRQQVKYSEIDLEEAFSVKKNELIERQNLQSKELYFIFNSELTNYFSFESCQIDIRLFKQYGEYYPIIFYNDSISIEATELLHKPENSEQKAKKVEWGLYLKLIKDPNAKLDYETIIPFEDLLDLDLLVKDSRLVWGDNSLFSFVANNSDANQWFDISNNCPIDVLKLYMDEYKEDLDWTSLSLRIDDDFLIQNATKYSWNFEAISAKENISIKVIKTLLLIPELKEQEWDWDTIMPQLDFEFIKKNINKVDFELLELTNTNINAVKPLVSLYPTKKWDWLYIATEYDLSYLLENISEFSKYLNLVEIANRAFTSKDDVFSFCRSEDFKEVLSKAKESKLSNYFPSQADYIWSETLIDLLESIGYLTWESGKYTLGFECNPYTDWSYDFFNKYHSKITTQKGFDFVSSQVLDTNIITDFIEFNWNWDLISANSKLINNSSFVLSVKDRLNFGILLSEIQDETLEAIFESAGLLSFLKKNPDSWTSITKKSTKEFILQHIDYDWDWDILTKRFSSTIKIEALGNVNWIDKWDWKYLTRNLDFSTIIDKLGLYIDRWDWKFISEKADKQFILEKLPDYNEYWNWEILLNERLDKDDLQLAKLIEVATCISIFDNELKHELWQVITCKFEYNNLELLIAQTYNHEIFYWDYSYFYNLSEFNLRQYLTKNNEFVSWTELSQSKALNKSFTWDKSLFSYKVWLKDVLKVLKNQSFKWNFKSLSMLESINWNDSILSIESVRWDWDYLSEYSRCFRKEKDFSKRFRKFSKYINFQIFSKRTDSDITEKLLTDTITNDWDWGFLSANKSVKITIRFIEENNEKKWDWRILSARKNIEFDNESILELHNKDWDWQEISRRTDITFSDELVSKLYDKPLDWLLVSQNKTFTPNTKALSLLHGKVLDWNSISNNPNLSVEVLWDYKELLNWQGVTKNDVIEISDISFLKKYRDYVDWNFVSQSEKFIVSVENLKQFKDNLNWSKINIRPDLAISESLLEPFADVLNWSNVSQSMEIKFTEELIEKYRNKWDWQLLKQNPQVLERLDTLYKKYKAEFNSVEFIEQFDNVPYIYHFTHLYNAIDIIKDRKILSRNKAEGKFANAAGNLVTRRATAHNFARFYFRPQTPTQFYNECLGWDNSLVTDYDKSYYSQARNLGLPKCPIPVFFKFDLKESLLKMANKCYYSTGNMQTNWASVIKVADKPNELNTTCLYYNMSEAFDYASEHCGDYNPPRFKMLMSRYISDCKQYSQQEFLVEEDFDFSNLDSFEIICYNDEYVNILKSQLGDDPICEKIHSDGWEVFHRDNRELHITEIDSEISIESEYKDSAYLSIKGEGLKNIEILDTENIQKETDSEIIAYPKIKFLKTDQPIEVYFVDTTIGKRDWLIYKS